MRIHQRNQMALLLLHVNWMEIIIAFRISTNKKSQDLFSSLQLQLPKAFNNLDYDTILHQSNNIVKTSGVRIDGIDNKSQMTLERWGEQYSELTKLPQQNHYTFLSFTFP